MKRKLVYLFLCLFLCVFLAGCGSTEPEETEEETPVVDAVPETPAAPAVEDDSAAKAEAAKKEAAAKAVADARDAAVKAGAADLLPDELQLADEKVSVLLGDPDYETASKKAVAYYNALEKTALGYALYDEIVENEYDIYASDSFGAALAAADELAALWEADADPEAIRAKVDEAYALLVETKEKGYEKSLLHEADQIVRQLEYFRNQALEVYEYRDLLSLDAELTDLLGHVDSIAGHARTDYEATGNLSTYRAAASEAISGYKVIIGLKDMYEAATLMTYEDFVERNYDLFMQILDADEKLSNYIYDRDYTDFQDMIDLETFVTENCWKIYYDSYKNDANAERARYADVKKKADSIKANVAAKAEYAAAVKFLTDGDASASRGQWDKAYENYLKAADAMTDVYELVSEKRAAAQDAIDRARARAEEAEELAVMADEKAPLSDEEAAE